MKCVDFEVRLNELLDARASLAGNVPLAEHARICPQCHELLVAYQELFQALPHVVEFRVGESRVGECGVPECEINVTPRVMSAIRSSEGQESRELPTVPSNSVPSNSVRSRTRRRLGYAAAMLAVAVALLLAAWLPSWFSKPPSGNINPIAGNPSPAPKGGSHNKTEGVREQLPQIDVAKAAQESYRELAEQTSDGLSDVAALVPSMDESTATAAAGNTLAGTAQTSLPRLAPNVAEGLKPVTRSTAGTFSMFFRVFPSSQPVGKP